ncbi:MAG: hypothetical protein DRJ47_04035 [Thermoprotei archaeon]|nr:MAG: hypothetical protein DRJ47_04035 [Thermoprotei archaeon]
METLFSRLVKSLMQLGLRNYEARAYATIAIFREATAPNIAERSGIPTSKIYSVLKSLEERGLIECQNGRPKIYRITDPDYSFSNLIKVYEEKKNSIVKLLNEITGLEEQIHGGVWVVRGARNVIRKIKELLKHAETCIAFAAPDFLYKKFIQDLIEAGRNGKTLSLVIYETDRDLTENLASILGRYSKVKRRFIPTVVTILIDRKVGLSSYYSILNEKGETHLYAIVIEEESLLRLLNDFFHLALWITSEELRFNLATRFRKPQSYTHFWRVVEDAKYFIDKGLTLKASVEGRLPKTGEITVVEGKITDVNIDYNWLKYSLTISSGRKKYEIGGWGCVVEEIEGLKVVLHPPK